MTIGAIPAAGDKIYITFEKMPDGRMGLISTSGNIGGRLNLPAGEAALVYQIEGTQRLEIVDQNAAVNGLDLVRAASAYCDFMHQRWRNTPAANLEDAEMRRHTRNLFTALRAAAGLPEPPEDV
jgi:hypothetical protein